MTNSANDIRRSFLQYFERHQHKIVASSPLVPHDDPTLLFTNAGMNQFKDAFLGREKRSYTRATTAQKCMRVSGKHNDLDNVGPSLRHHTFFEMLGNFSFGDYFKQDAIPFAWGLLTDTWKLPPDRLYATVFKGEAGIPGDEEAYGIWKKVLPAERIGELGAADNFWQMGDTGPCGRCSEIYYYRGSDIPCASETAGHACRGLECDCDRYIEIWNNVFMEFDRQADGILNPLPAPSIDTGMGLERITAVLQGHLSNYDTDLFTPLLDHIGVLAGLVYGARRLPRLPDVPAAAEAPSRLAEGELIDISMRVVADHMRATTFLISDGVEPSNEGRGYVLRKIMRRAMRHGQRLGLERPLLHQLVDTVVKGYSDAYPELISTSDHVIDVVHAEERKFEAVLREGLPRLERVLREAENGNRVVSGQAAFQMYDTFGVPRDFIEDMTASRGLTLDTEGFEQAMRGQKEKARTKSKFVIKAEPGEITFTGMPPTLKVTSNAPDKFRGYDVTGLNTKVVELLDSRYEPAIRLTAGEKGLVALAETPFYVESGGQVSDLGRLIAPDGEAQVTGVIKGSAGTPRFHVVTVTRGTVTHDDLVNAEVDVATRDATRRNHTATHLLHAALRQVLGPHVKQAGSLVAPDRLRFDFVHTGAVTRDQLVEIERIVNEHVLKNTPVQTEVRKTEEAIAAGAMALFGEKYGDSVRVVSVSGFSMELCGGTHVRATGDIGLFVIMSEGGVSAGVRRIEAITGLESLALLQRNREELSSLAGELNTRPGELAARIRGLQDENKRLARELQQAKMSAALGGAGSGSADDAVDISGIKLVAREVAGLDKDGLRALVDKQRDRIKSGVVVLAAPSDGKVTIVVGVTPDLTKKIPAGEVVKQLAPIVGGRGGGRGDFAEAGGKDLSKISEVLNASRAIVEKILAQGKD